MTCFILFSGEVKQISENEILKNHSYVKLEQTDQQTKIWKRKKDEIEI